VFIITPDFRSHQDSTAQCATPESSAPTILLPALAEPLPPLCRQFR
jgi:hypothetical protein